MRKGLKPRSLGMEKLEGRDLLAGGGWGFTPQPVSHPAITFTNKSVPALDLLPGATDVSLAKFSLKANNARGYGRLEEVLVLPALGSEQLNGNVESLTLRADLNGRAKDGYEAVIAWVRPDWQTDIADFMVYKPVWIRGSKPVEFQITAEVSSWPWSETTDAYIGVEVAQVFLRNLRSQPVPEEKISYNGADPALHTLETKLLGVYQQQVDTSGSVLVDQKDVKLLRFDVGGSSGVALNTVSFVAGQGSLSNAVNYSLTADTNWDGVIDYRFFGKSVDDRLTFSLPIAVQSSGAWEVHADIIDVLPNDPQLQVVFATDTLCVTASDEETGKVLQGVVINGSGAGQIKLWQDPKNSPVYNIVKDPELVVKELGAGYRYERVEPGQQGIVLDTFTMYNQNNPWTLNSVSVVATEGDFSWLTNFTLWWDSNNDNVVDKAFASMGERDGNTVVFSDILRTFLAGVSNEGKSTRFEVRADALEDIAYGNVRAQLSGAKASRTSGDPILADKVFMGLSRQTNYWLKSNSGIGIAELQAQIAALMAQLQALQPGGMG